MIDLDLRFALEELIDEHGFRELLVQLVAILQTEVGLQETEQTISLFQVGALNDLRVTLNKNLGLLPPIDACKYKLFPRCQYRDCKARAEKFCSLAHSLAYDVEMSRRSQKL
jgi:hypothetical protein